MGAIDGEQKSPTKDIPLNPGRAQAPKKFKKGTKKIQEKVPLKVHKKARHLMGIDGEQ